MAGTTGGALVVRALEAAGVTTLFGLHGAHIDTIFQACRGRGLQMVDTRHEASAGHAAEGYARTSRQLGVAVVTAGGGFTNVLTSVANAFFDRTPVLYLAGSGSLGEDETNTLQAGVDQVAVAEAITKWSHRVTRTEQIPRLVAQAIRIATAAPRGPVLLDVPWDVLSGEVDDDAPATAGPSLPAGASRPAPAEVEAALSVLAGAARPVIVAGSELQRSPAGVEALGRLARALGVPTFADFEGLGAITSLGECCAGLVQGLLTFPAAGVAPDAVLLLGARFGLNTGHGTGTLIPKGATVVQVDPDARELGRLREVAVAIAAEVGGAAAALAEAAEGRAAPDRSEWRARAQAVVRARLQRVGASADEAATAERLHPFHASAELAAHLGPDHVVVADGALTYLWLSEVIAQARPAAFLTHGYFGSMGFGTGTALGAALAAQREGRRAVLVTGDGAIGYALGEFDTMFRHGLPLVVVVMNNRAWGATLHYQQLVGGSEAITNTRLDNGDYDRVAQALGAEGYLVTDRDSLAKALEEALGRDGPACINVLVSGDHVPPEEAVLVGQNPFAE